MILINRLFHTVPYGGGFFLNGTYSGYFLKKEEVFNGLHIREYGTLLQKPDTYIYIR